jgi:ABC-type methionine transport system permease subunit
MENNPTPIQEGIPAPAAEDKSASDKKAQKTTLTIIIAAVVVVLALLVVGAVFLFQTDANNTSRIRDIFIIFMALESFVIGLALIILIVQLASLINLIQNEIRPILNSTNETVNTLRGTAAFLSDNLAEPVIKVNAYIAGLKRIGDIFRRS